MAVTATSDHDIVAAPISTGSKRFKKLTSPRSLSRLKQMRQQHHHQQQSTIVANWADQQRRCTPAQDSHRLIFPAVPSVQNCSSSSSGQDSPTASGLRRRSASVAPSSSLSPSLSSSVNIFTASNASQAATVTATIPNGKRDASVSHFNSPRPPFLGETARDLGSESSDTSHSSFWGSSGSSNFSVSNRDRGRCHTSTNASSSTLNTTPASSYRGLGSSDSIRGEISAASKKLMTRRQSPTKANDKAPTRLEDGSHSSYTVPAANVVKAMGRKLLRLRQSSSTDDSGASSLDKSSQEESKFHTYSSASTVDSSPPTTPSSPRKGLLHPSYSDVEAPQLPPLRSLLSSSDNQSMQENTSSQRSDSASRFDPSSSSQRNSAHADAILSADIRYRPGASKAHLTPIVHDSTMPPHSDSGADVWHLLPSREESDQRASGESLDLLEALEAAMSLGSEESNGDGSHSEASLLHSLTVPSALLHTTPATSLTSVAQTSAMPRVLTVAQVAQLEEDDRTSKSRSSFSKAKFFSRPGLFSAHPRPRRTSSLSSQSEDDYGEDEDSWQARRQDREGSSVGHYTEDTSPLMHEDSDNTASPRPHLFRRSFIPIDRNKRSFPIVTPGRAAPRSAPSWDSPAKRALYNCSLLKQYPQLDDLLKPALFSPLSRERESGRGQLEFYYPRSVNTPAKLRAAAIRGGSQPGMPNTNATAATRRLAVALALNIIRRKVPSQLTREEEVEIGWFVRDYATEFVPSEVLLSRIHLRQRKEALAIPSVDDGDVNSIQSAGIGDSTPAVTRETGIRAGVKLWAARKPFIQRCVMTRGEESTMFNVGDVVLDPKQAAAAPLATDVALRGAPLVFSPRIRSLANLDIIPVATVPSDSIYNGTRLVGRVPPPWVASRSWSAKADIELVSTAARPASPPREGSDGRVEQFLLQTLPPIEDSSNTSVRTRSRSFSSDSGSDTTHGHSQVTSDSNLSNSNDEGYFSAADSVQSMITDQEEDDVPIAHLVERKQRRRTADGWRYNASTETLTERRENSPPSVCTIVQVQTGGRGPYGPYRRQTTPSAEGTSPQFTGLVKERGTLDFSSQIIGIGTARESNREGHEGDGLDHSRVTLRLGMQADHVFGVADPPARKYKTLSTRASSQRLVLDVRKDKESFAGSGSVDRQKVTPPRPSPHESGRGSAMSRTLPMQSVRADSCLYDRNTQCSIRRETSRNREPESSPTSAHTCSGLSNKTQQTIGSISSPSSSHLAPVSRGVRTSQYSPVTPPRASSRASSSPLERPCKHFGSAGTGVGVLSSSPYRAVTPTTMAGSGRIAYRSSVSPIATSQGSSPHFPTSPSGDHYSPTRRGLSSGRAQLISQPQTQNGGQSAATLPRRSSRSALPPTQRRW